MITPEQILHWRMALDSQPADELHHTMFDALPLLLDEVERLQYMQKKIKYALQFADQGILPVTGVNLIREAVYGEPKFNEAGEACPACFGEGTLDTIVIEACPNCTGKGVV